jgi:hypothetical protein
MLLGCALLTPFVGTGGARGPVAATRKDELNMPVFSAHQNMAWPQLHEDSIPELAFWRAVAKLMAVCGVNDFTRDDLARPDAKRLRKQLSGLINFAKVCITAVLSPAAAAGLPSALSFKRVSRARLATPL